MKLANLDGRAVIVTADGSGIDVERASSGSFGPQLQDLYQDWDAFTAWAAGADLDASGASSEAIDPARLGAPSPMPRQILAFGLNYDSHAKESGFDAPDRLPPLFPKFVSSLTGPVTTVTLPEGGNTDWEVELVAVIGRETRDIDESQGWDVVAGLTVGQDISERVIQLSGPAPQFGLGKSYPGFTATGPWLVTTDEFADRDDIGLSCTLDGETMQDGRTRDLIMSVPQLIAGLSQIITLYPGDLVFTGTPAGVGLGRDPQRYIAPDQVLVSTIEGIGELRQTFVAATGPNTSTSSNTSTPSTSGATS